MRLCDYLVVAQLFLRDNFLLERTLEFSDIKPRLLGHWGTCHGINLAYANLRESFGRNFQFVLGPGHGFPALQANLFVDGELEKVDARATRDAAGIAYVCRNFSWPDGFPSHASPMTPGVICGGGELGYALATGYGAAMGHPEKTVAVLIGDGEFETATTLGSLNLVKILGERVERNRAYDKIIEGQARRNGKVIPILHLNGYKISAPSVVARKSEREIGEQLRGFGYEPIFVDGEKREEFQGALEKISPRMATTRRVKNPFIVMKTEKGAGGPKVVGGKKVEGNYLAHQIPLKRAGTDEGELRMLEEWLRSYGVREMLGLPEGAGGAEKSESTKDSERALDKKEVL